MENQDNRLQAFGHTVANIIDGLLDFLLLLAVALFFVIRIPSVQTRAVREVSDILSKKLGHQVSIERVDIEFFNNVILDKVKVLDRKNEVLFYVGKLEADISLFNIFNPNKLYISNMTLEEPRANLIRYRGTDTLNMSSFITAVNKLLKKKEPTKTKTPFDFQIDAVTLKNGFFTYHDQNKPRAKAGMDYQHMVFDSINAQLTDIQLGDTVSVRVTDLHTYEVPSRTHLHDLDTHMRYAAKFWEFADLNLRLGRSRLANYIRFDYNRFRNFRQFNDSVTVTANLKDALIYSDDVGLFAPQVKKLNDKIAISGEIKGKTKRFNVKNLDARYGTYSRIVGNISATGLPAIRETFIELDLRPSVLNARDIRKYIPKKSYDIASRLGTVKLKGNFVGFYNDFVANGSFVTALGNVESDLNLKINQVTNASAYSGYLKTNNFQLGKLLGNTKLISTVSIDGRIKGSGFTPETANLAMNAKINSVTIRGYTYQNIITDATFKDQLINGDFEIHDPNINLTARGEVNVSQSAPSFNLTTDIANLNLKGLGLSRENIRIKTNADLNFTGLKLDDILGQGRFGNTTLTLNQNTVHLDSLLLRSSLANGQRGLTFNSEIADLTAAGNWNYTTLLHDIKTLLHEYQLNFESNTEVTNAYYRRKKQRPIQEYELNYTINLKQFNPVLQAFAPQLTLGSRAAVEGSFRQGPNAIFTLLARTDTVQYGKNRFYQNEIEFNTSKLPYSPDVLANAIVSSRRQQLTTGGATENLLLEGVWNERTIQFTSNIAQTGSTNRANLTGSLAFLNDKLQIIFSNSNINLLGKEWRLTPNNTIEIAGAGKEINFRNFDISHQNQHISIQGLLSQNPANNLNAEITNFRLENLNPLFAKNRFQGIINGTLSARDIYQQAIITSKLTADSLYLDNYLVGRVTGTTNWDNRQNRLGVDLDLTRENMKVLTVTGYYNPRSEENQLDLLAVMDEAPLKLIEPLLSTLFSDLSGTMAGRLNIGGRITAPALAGSALITDGRFNFKYLNTVYTFTDRIFFTENDITFKNVKLRDILNNTGTLSGSIIHQGFKDMVLDLRGDFRKFMVLNTTREQNKIYYGTAIATGSATVLGSPSNLTINIDATSEAGTRMSIPLDNNATVTRQNFIRFVNRNTTDTTATAPAAATGQVDLAGINMNFNLNITPDAYLEIILDQTSGDIVRGSGNGRINMNIDTRGEFTMEGQVEIVRGAYNFTLYNIFNKEFLVRPGGTITWTGDPYAGVMNITATYTQTVPLPSDVIAVNSTNNTNSNNRQYRIPVTAIMHLTGNLLTPEIRLDIEFTNAPSELEAQLAPYLADIRNDQDELNRNVFSLLILKRLSERNTIGGAGGGGQSALQQGFTGSISELFTNQLGNLLSQLDENLEVDIGLAGIDEVKLQNLQVRLSYSLLEGRLRLSREGAFGNNNITDTNTNNPTLGNQNTIAGDWRVEYYLGQNGKLRARLEYITSQRGFGTNNVTTRISLLHTEQFDTLGELFARRRVRKRIEERKKALPTLDDDPRIDFNNMK